VAVGTAKYDEIKMLATESVGAEYNVSAFALQIKTGYEIIKSTTNITPTATIRYVNIKTKPYTDTLEQRISSNNSSGLTGLVGVKFDKKLSVKKSFYTIINSDCPTWRKYWPVDWKEWWCGLKSMQRNFALYPEFRIGLGYDFINESGEYMVRVGDVSYRIKEQNLKPILFEIGLGITGSINDRLSLSVNYDGQFRKYYNDNTFLFKMKFEF
jgi:hypothetical protein